MLVQCIASMTVNNQLFPSLTQEKCALIQNGVLNHRSQQIVCQHKVKKFRSVKTNFLVIMLNIQTNNEIISNGHVHHKLAGKLSICFSCFQSNSWWSPGEDCIIHVTCETASFWSSVHIIFSCVIERNNWLLTPIEVIHWCNIISKFGTFSCTEFYVVMFSNFISLFFGLVYFESLK